MFNQNFLNLYNEGNEYKVENFNFNNSNYRRKNSKNKNHFFIFLMSVTATPWDTEALWEMLETVLGGKETLQGGFTL